VSYRQNAEGPVFDTVCPCGHLRRDHADMFQRCEECDCTQYRGEFAPRPGPPLYVCQTYPYEPDNPPGEPDDVLMGDLL
jgi:hypothetical protein